jgi:hypothetical protein
MRSVSETMGGSITRVLLTSTVVLRLRCCAAKFRSGSEVAASGGPNSFPRAWADSERSQDRYSRGGPAIGLDRTMVLSWAGTLVLSVTVLG